MTTLEDFEKIDIRVGEILEVSEFPEARKPAYKLTINFGGEIGVKKSSVQITNYDAKKLVGRQILAVVNFPPRQIGKFISEVLTLGVPDESKNVILVTPDAKVALGAKLF